MPLLSGIPATEALPRPVGKPELPTDSDLNDLFWDADYAPQLNNWYAARPYGFEFTSRIGKVMVMYLPIAPSNLQVTTHFATSVVPTIYGTVEEHSPVRYYDINIEGTTGMGPRYVKPFKYGATPGLAGGRSRFSVKQAIDPNAAGGLFAKTIARANEVVSETKDLFGAGPEPVTGLQLDQTGYLAFHNLYRFLLKYKKDASGEGADGNKPRLANSHPLIFFNYKDNNQYKVVVRSFTMRRDANDPMLYHYNIAMRGYDLVTVDSAMQEAASDLLTDLGLNGVDGSTLLGKVKKKADQARGILANVGKGIKGLGS